MVSERFGNGLKLVLGVRAQDISGVTTLVVDDVQVRRSNIQPERNATAVVLVDADQLDIRIEFQDDSLEHRTILGGSKERFEDDTNI